MNQHKLASFTLALIAILLFPTKSTAQSEKELVWWADGLARKRIEYIEESLGTTYNTRAKASSVLRGLKGLPILTIFEADDDAIWETLKNRLDDNNMYDAIKIMEHIKTKNIPSINSQNITNYFNNKVWENYENSINQENANEALVFHLYIESRKISPDNTTDKAQTFFLLGTQLANEKDCSRIKNALFAYKTALSLDNNLNQEKEIYQFADFCYQQSSKLSNDDFYPYVLAYVIGLKLNPSSESYLKLSSAIAYEMLYSGGERFDEYADIILDAVKQVLELPDKKVTLTFPLYFIYDGQAIVRKNYGYLPNKYNNWGEEVTSSSHALAYTLIGNISASSGSLNEANDAFQQAIAINPNLSMAYAGIGKNKILQIQFEDAEKYLRKAIELNPNYADTYNSLGDLYTKQEQLKRAVDAYRKAVSIKPAHSLYVIKLDEAEKQLSLANQLEPKLDDSVRSSVVIVKTKSSTRENCGDATGWIVSNRNNQALIVTNRHVVQECNNINIVLYDNPSISLPAEVFKVDEEKDLAVLKASNLPTDIKPIAIASTQPNNNDTVFVIGHPYQGGGESWTTVKGEISAIILGNELLQLDITVDGGNSGSPVLNKDNEVTGLLFELSNDKRLESFATGRFGFAYPINVVREKLNLWEVPYENK